MNDNSKEIKQIIVLVAVLIIIIIISVAINHFGLSTDEVSTENTAEEGSSDEVYTINGITEDELESMKDSLTEEEYEEYKTLFEEYEEGITPYVSEENEIKDEDKLTEAEQNELVTEADENGEYYYYVTEDGTVTNTKIYTNLDLGN